ncbi:MAG: c-type cytochrome biogenesis protein CcmI [Gammaproteobacteria bacterium]
MNLMFWALMVSMLLIAIILLVYPLLKVRQKSALAYKESNLKINDEKIKELNLDLQEGRIEQHFYKAARDELDRELLIDIPAESSQTAALHYTNSAKRHPAWALTISVFVPALVLLLYLGLGMHAASEDTVAENQQQTQQQQLQDEQSIEEMADKLEARIAEKGGTVEDWAMLARARKYLGQNELAAKAFAVALENDAENAQLMLENAEMIAVNNNRIFTPEARALVLKAYSLEPDNANVLWFIGVSEYQQENYRQAIDHLTKLLPLVAGEEEVMKSVVTVVAKSREQLIAAGEEMPELEELFGVTAMAKASSSANSSTSAPPKSSEVPATKLNIAVDVSAEVRSKFDAGDSIFVYAKAKQGPRMPLAVQRLTLAELPANVTLDDSMAMVEGMNMSAFEPLVVSARVTKSGSAITQSGDYIGRLEIKDKTSKKTIKIIIDTVVP